jgi:hypothetical protein
MDNNRAETILEETFNNAFNKQIFIRFITNLLNDIDTSENKYREYHGNLIKESFRTHIVQYIRLGKYEDPDGKTLDVLIVEVVDSKKLDCARTTLRNFVIDHLKNFKKDYALAAFYSKTDDGRNWRFSFIKLEHRTLVKNGEIRQRRDYTSAYRYSFLVGIDEKSHTAKRQLLPLLQEVRNNSTIEKIAKAFSIEVVTDEFFEQYKKLFLRISDHLETLPLVISALEVAGTSIPRFTKKLLGQLVFLYFLQKKGWLGVPRSAKWGKGPKNFLQSLYEHAENKGENFFTSYLRYLFYEALAHQHGKDNFYKKLNCRIPFLNGGLFEANYDWENIEINFPNSLFRNDNIVAETGDIGTGILDVFDRYNFTIREDEPLEKEVAIDPEMLGKVFERMLEITERKEKGTFYTPREIVHHMCQESLIHYLDTALTKETIVSRIDIEDFVYNGIFYIEHDARVIEKGKETKTYNFLLPESIRKNADCIDRLFTHIKVCDPAIGSGAFPVCLLNELVLLQSILCKHLSNGYLSQKLNLIGLRPEEYDRNPEKYLYLVKRYNIQESIYGVDIDLSAIDIARLRLWLSLVVDEEDYDNIEALPNLDYKIVGGNSLVGLPDAIVYDSCLKDEIEHLKEVFFLENNDSRKRTLRQEINTKIKSFLKSTESFASYKIDFDYKLFFSEIWRKNGGFDIVIGNPPYVSTKGTSIEEKRIFKYIYGFADDTYSHFFFKGISLLSTKGSLTYITPKTFWTTQTKRNLRDMLLSRRMLYIFDTADPFSVAMVDTCITSVSAIKNSNDHFLFLDGSKGLMNPVPYPLIGQSIYRNALNSVIFKPTVENLKIYNLYGKKIKELYNQWWDKIKTSKAIEENRNELETYRNDLKPGDIALLGCLTEGGQGLATANNGKYIAVRRSTKWAKNILKSRPQKLAEAVKKRNIAISGLDKYANTTDFLASLNEKEITTLFDELKEKYGRDIFGQGYVYRLIDDNELADVDALTDEEKRNGISTDKNYYVPYDKGDKDGNRWYLDTPFAIAWSQENVGFLKANSGKKGEGMPVVRNSQFYFKEGFCWTDVNSTFLKARVKRSSIFDVLSMSLFTQIDIPDWYFVCIINSSMVSFYVDNFINNTSHFQINDARKVPIIIPSKTQLSEFEHVFKTAIKIKQNQIGNKITDSEANSCLIEIQNRLDEITYFLYKMI